MFCIRDAPVANPKIETSQQWYRELSSWPKREVLTEECWAAASALRRVALRYNGQLANCKRHTSVTLANLSLPRPAHSLSIPFFLVLVMSQRLKGLHSSTVSGRMHIKVVWLLRAIPHYLSLNVSTHFDASCWQISLMTRSWKRNCTSTLQSR